jgi:hypothetical protein
MTDCALQLQVFGGAQGVRRPACCRPRALGIAERALARRTHGVTACLLAACFGGMFVGPRVRNPSIVGAALLAMGVATGSLALGALVGSLPEYILHRHPEADLGSAAVAYIVNPTMLVLIGGIVQAAVLGVCYGVVLRAVLRRRSREEMR